MKKFNKVLVLSHIAYRKDNPLTTIEGPYASLCQALEKMIKRVDILGLPLVGYQNGIMYGQWKRSKNIPVPSFLGEWQPIKFAFDILVNNLVALFWSLANYDKQRLIIAIDPLSCFPLWLYKKIFGFVLVYHCVDFNKNRFQNKWLQRLYELADEWASRYADQTWVICESLQDYKKNNFGLRSYYMPNSVIFDPSITANRRLTRTGDKMVWTGSLMTKRQFETFFKILAFIQAKIKPDIKLILAPTKEHDKFDSYVKKYKLKQTKVLRLNGRKEFQEMAAKCDVGIAIYDENFGSTKFIEPMKIWDFLLCGLPFIVSSEPSISEPIKKSLVAYRLGPKNAIPSTQTMKSFLAKKNLANLIDPCLLLAKRFDIENQVKKRIKSLEGLLI